MRLAIVSTDPGIAFGGPKGAAVHLAELAGALAHRGTDVLLLVAEIAPAARPPHGVTLERLPGPARASAAERVAGQDTLTLWLERRLRDFRADALYERLALHSTVGAATAVGLAIPYLVELNAPLPEEAATYRRLDHPEAADRLERLTLASAGRVFAVSRPLAAYALGRGAEEVEVLPNAVAAHRFPERLEPGADPPRAVFLGALRPWHGIEAIGRAWELLGRDAPELLVVGDGPGRERLAALGAVMVGAVDHSAVPGLLAQAEIGLAPYAADAPAYFSPLKLFEYLAAGLATIAADLPGVADVVTPGCVVRIPRGDAPALAEAVRALSADPELRAAMGRAGRALVLERHTWERRADRVLEVVGELGRAGLPAVRDFTTVGP